MALSRFAQLRLLITLGLIAAPASAQVIYVDDDVIGMNDGSSWSNAFTDLQSALAVAQAGDQVWVATGTYKPSAPLTGGGSRTDTFNVFEDLEIYGGFDGTELTLGARAGLYTQTILSGDLNSDDGPDFTNYGDNSLHVITATSDFSRSVVDGFTITAGNAEAGRGGGLLFVYGGGGFGGPTLANCEITLNLATSGGGISISDSAQLLMSNCTLSGNRATSQGGAIMGTDFFTAVTLEDCDFIGNSAVFAGGAVRSDECFVRLTACSFIGNTSDAHGGAVFSSGELSFTATDCSFIDNYADDHGAGLRLEDSNFIFGQSPSGRASVTRCVFENNLADGSGGGLYTTFMRRVSVVSCVFQNNRARSGAGMAFQSIFGPTEVFNTRFSGNIATQSGGGIHDFGTQARVMNCEFIGNSAGSFGGGYRGASGTIPTITNSTFVRNSSSTGGGLHIDGFDDFVNPSRLTLTNSIVYLNSDAGGMNESAQLGDPNATAVVNYSNIQGLTGLFGGTGNLGSPPLFVDAVGCDGIAGTDDDDLRLQFGSPCLDAGDNTSVMADLFDLDGNSITAEPTPIDLLGSARFQDDPGTPDTGNGVAPIVDMGAHEGATLPNDTCFPSLCNGDGGNQLGCTNCPCSNNAPQGTPGGCLNSVGSSALLAASGDPSVTIPTNATSDLRFAVSGVPANAFCILNSGDTVAPINAINPCFGLDSGVQAVQFDGLRCAVINTRRHGGRSADANGDVGVGGTVSPWGGEGGPPLGLARGNSGFVAGQTRYFQVIHRDDHLLSCMRGLNTSQAIEILFTP